MTLTPARPPSLRPRFWDVIHSTERLRTLRWAGDLVAVAIIAAALGLRLLIDDALPPGFPFLTFFPAVILTTFFFGLRPGIICAGLGGLAAWYFFIPPARSFALSPSNALALAFYTFIVSVDIGLIHIMHLAASRLREKTDANAQLYQQQRTMFQELQHRVANNVQFIASLLALSRRKAQGDPAQALVALDEARVRLDTISRIHRYLYDPVIAARPAAAFFQELCDDLIEAAGARNIVCRVQMPPVQFGLDRLTPLSLIVVEIVTNALKHAFPNGGPGVITIRLDHNEGRTMTLTIADNGKGLPPGYDPASSRSLGLRIVQNLAAQLSGRVTFATEGGTVARLEFEPRPSA